LNWSNDGMNALKISNTETQRNTHKYKAQKSCTNTYYKNTHRHKNTISEMEKALIFRL